MSKVEEILKTYPLILELQNAYYSLKEICIILREQHNIEINYNSLTPIISKIKNKNIHPEYAKFALLLTSKSLQALYEPYSIKLFDFWICFNTSKYKTEWLITKDNFQDIPNPVGLLYAKRFLKLYEIPDEELIKTYIDTYRLPITSEENELIKNISTDIKTTYDKIMKELKIKTLQYIMRNK